MQKMWQCGALAGALMCLMLSGCGGGGDDGGSSSGYDFAVTSQDVVFTLMNADTDVYASGVTLTVNGNVVADDIGLAPIGYQDYSVNLNSGRNTATVSVDSGTVSLAVSDVDEGSISRYPGDITGGQSYTLTFSAP